MRTRLLAGGVFLLLLVLAAEVYLAAGGLSNRARQIIVEQSAALLGQPVAVSEVYLSILPPRAVFRGVTLPPAEPWLQGGTLEAVKVRLSPWSLLTGGIRSFDITLLNPDIQLHTPKSTLDHDQNQAALKIPWGAWTTYRLRLVNGRVVLNDGGRDAVLEGLSFTAQPDVTLRAFEIDLSTQAVSWDGERILDSADVALTLRADHLRVRSVQFSGPAGALSLSGEVRSEDGVLVAGLKTVFDGELADAASLVQRFGGTVPELVGSAHLTGRLYGALDALHWDGEFKGEHIALPGQEREMERVDARLRMTKGQVDLVHAKVVAGGGELRATGKLTFGDENTYKTRLRADDVSLSWLLGELGPYGSVSGEAFLKGMVWGHPQGTVTWRYRNPGADKDHPDGVTVKLWKRLAVKLVSGRGDTSLTADGAQQHELDLQTPDSRIDGRISVDIDGGLDGELTAHTDDFADLGMLIGLPYVHGKADAGARLGGSLSRFELSGTGTLADGRIRDLNVGRMTGHITLTPERFTFRDVHSSGDGRIAMAGTLDFPPRDKRSQGLTVHLAANLKQVPLSPLAGLFYLKEPLALNLPVSGRVNLVLRPDKLAVWAKVTAAAGDLYGQPVHGAKLGLWIDRGHMVLSPVRVDVMDNGRVATAEGEGNLRWKDGSYQIHLNTVRLPLSAIQVLDRDIPFLRGTFAGDVTLVGDFDDPLLKAEGSLRDVSFYGNPVGRGRFDLALSGWQLRLSAELSGPGVGEANPPGRLVYYNRLAEDGPFALSVRLTDADVVPWLRGLLPEVDALTREQLGDDYGLNASGRVSAAGTIADGPTVLRMGLSDATLGAGGLVAHLLGRADLSLKDGTLSIPPLALEGNGLTLTLGGEMVPEQRFDLKIAGSATAPWLDHVRPEYGVIGGASGFNLNVTGDWDAPWVSGTVRPDALVVAPPELVDIKGIITLSGDVAVSGLLEEPQDGAVRASFSSLSLTAFDNTVSAAGVGLLGSDGIYTLPTGVELTGQIGRLRVSGGWHYGKTLALEAVGTLHLSDILPQVPGLSNGSGEVRVSGELTGPWDDPEINGGAALDAGRLHIDSLGQVLQIDAASVLLNGSRVVLDHLEGQIGGGLITARGAYDTADQDVTLIVSLEGYNSRPLAGLSATLSGEFSLTGALPVPTLSGDLHIHRALFDRRMQWGAWVVDMIAVGQQEIARVVPFGDTHLSLRLFGDRDIVVDNNLAKLVMELDLLATGTLSEPGLVGRMKVRSGEIEFRGHVFAIDYANLDFVSPDRIAPYLDVLAHTTVQHTLPDDPLGAEPVDVDLSLNGPMDKMDFTLSSRPDLPQNDLLSLLAVGRTVEDLSGSGVGAGEATYLVTGKLQTRLEEQIHRFTGLDRFQVDPFYAEDATETNSARLTVGKKLFDGKGRITYSTVVDASKEPLINFSYRIGPRISLLLEQDEEGRQGGEVRYRIRFR